MPLVVLAILSVGGGWMAAPQLWGGVNHFEHFLAPVLTTASGPVAAATESAAGGGEILQALLGAPVIAGPSRLSPGVVVLHQEPGNAEETGGFALRAVQTSLRKIFYRRIVLGRDCAPAGLDFRQSSVARRR